MNKMHTTLRWMFLCATGLAVLSRPAFSQKVGSTSMQFLKVMPCARATALGEAYSVWASGAEAIFWNPSGLALVAGREVSTSYIDWLFDTRQGAVSFAQSLGDLGAFGIQFQYVDFGTFEESTNSRPFITDPDGPGLTGRTFRPFSYLVGLTYARNLTDRFSLGFGAKYAHESLFNGETVRAMVDQGIFENVPTWGNALLFDFGIRYSTGYRSIQIAASVQNFGPDVKYAKESSPVPLLFRFGVGADLVGKDALLLNEEGASCLRAAFDIFHPNDYSQQGHLGVEYEFEGTVALRAGYKFNYDYESLTFGGGVRHAFSEVVFSVDYSYGSVGKYLGDVQRISLGVVLP